MKAVLYFQIILLNLFINSISYADQGTFQITSESQKKEIGEQIREATDLAKKRLRENRLTDSLKILFDANKMERKAGIRKTAGYEIYKISLSLIHKDPGPLMKLLRNPDIPLQEKIKIFSELREIAGSDRKDNEIPFRGKYSGNLVQIIKSPKLTAEQKYEILQPIEHIAIDEYLSKEQKDKIKETVSQMVTLADRMFREKKYGDAFRIMGDSVKMEGEARIGSEAGTAFYQLTESLLLIASQDDSPLMKHLRNEHVSLREKKKIFSELEELAERSIVNGDSIISKRKYNGTLVKIMNSKKLSTEEKIYILDDVKEIIVKQYSAGGG